MTDPTPDASFLAFGGDDAESSDDVKALEADGQQLLTLAKALDAPVPDEEFPSAVVALGQRARTLYCAVRQVSRGGARDVTSVLLRPMIEINLTLRFLAENPELHTQLWFAEGERGVVSLAGEILEATALKERWSEYVGGLTDEMLEPMRQAVKLARSNAQGANLAFAASGAVFPTADQIAKLLKEPAAAEGYTLAYRELSWEVHAGARAIAIQRFVDVGDGRVRYDRQRRPRVRSLALGVAVFASTMKLCLYHLGLDGVSEAESILHRWVPQSPEKPSRRGR